MLGLKRSQINRYTKALRGARSAWQALQLFQWTHKKGEAGDALVSVLIALGIFGVLATGVSQMMVFGFKATKSVSTRQDLETIRQTINNRMDCKATLGITESTNFPVSCASANLLLLRKDGSELGSPGGRIGDWTVTGSCVGKELLISAKSTSSGAKDPLTGKSLDSISSNSSGIPVSTDLFAGASDFCREYIDAGYTTCTDPPYDLFRGAHGGDKLCCREVNAVANVPGPGQAGIASCNADEWMMTGGGMCPLPLAPGVFEANPYFLHNSAPVGESWMTDCWAARDHTLDYDAWATAICCPK
ncbi:MAG: hypothetical protein H7318_04610 [Oligoflexus sp.]|nr:hypothetical protein [Oligoflexus sp.]